jgi:hypothetical protein
MVEFRRRACLALLASLLALPALAAAAEEGASLDDLDRRQQQLERDLEELRKAVDAKKEDTRVDEVERRQGILTEELRRLRDVLVLPENEELKSAYGLGPAASKVYGISRGVSIGGYGEANFKNVVSDRGTANDEFDFLRFVLYVGYKFNDWIVFNSETEFEHATTSEGGSVSVELATLDFLLHPMANVRAGLMLVPVGFINEVHEPPFFHGNVRPQVEQVIIPSTWRSPGFGLFGELLPGLEYRTYGLVSDDAKGFTSAGIRGGRQSGSFARAADWSWVGRLDYTYEAATIGGSICVGDTGQNQEFAGEEIDALFQLYELHAEADLYGFELRGLAAVSDLGDASQISLDVDDTVAENTFGWYLETAYDVLPLILPDTTHYLAPWVRYSEFDTQANVPDGFDRKSARDRQIFEVGLSYKPIPQVVLKFDYRNQNNQGGDDPDEIRIGGGFVF